MLPGSSPQGAYLGILLFIIIFNGALLRPSIPRPHLLNLKYIDVMSMLAAFNLKHIRDDPVHRPSPLNYYERTRHVLPLESNFLQEELNSLETFTSKKLLKIKEKKTNVMTFNFSRSQDFPPELVISGFNDQIEVIFETKLLGIILTNDLKWAGNTEYICKKAYKNMWKIRRMKNLQSCWMYI